MNLVEQINSHKFLFLEKLIEVNDLELILLIDEGRVDEDTEHDINEILENAPSTKYNPIISDEKCKKYKIIFSDCLTYLVRNETFTLWSENEAFVGEGFRKYSESKFLEYIKTATDIDYAKEFMDEEEYLHFRVCCENQIIDVMCANEPIIEEL